MENKTRRERAFHFGISYGGLAAICCALVMKNLNPNLKALLMIFASSSLGCIVGLEYESDGKTSGSV